MIMPAVLLLVLAAAVWTDLRSRRVPNRLILSGLAADLVSAFVGCWRRAGPGPLMTALLGGVLPIVLLFLLFHFRMMGAGDIKLFAVIGGWTGPEAVVHIIVCSFLAGGLISIILMLVRRNFFSRLAYLKSYMVSCLKTGKALPYRQQGTADAEFSFSIPVMIGFLMYLANIC